MILSSITENAASIPRETPLLNSTENQVQIVESLIADILDKVQAYNLGYALAAGYANTRIRKVVITHQTDGNNYRTTTSGKTATADENGTISPSDAVFVKNNAKTTFNILPDY